MVQGFGAPENGGAVDIVTDNEMPRGFTALARTAISGGQFVTVSGAANVIGSVMQTFVPGSIVVDLLGADENQAVGIALYNAGSNTPVAIATRGLYIATVGGVVSGGYPVKVISGTVQYVTNAVGVAGSTQPVGRALTAADSGTNHYALVNFSF